MLFLGSRQNFSSAGPDFVSVSFFISALISSALHRRREMLAAEIGESKGSELVLEDNLVNPIKKVDNLVMPNFSRNDFSSSQTLHIFPFK